VTIALALIVSLAGFAVSATDAMKIYLEKSMGSDYILMPQSLLLGSGNMGAGPELVESISEIDGVSDATGISRATSKAGSSDL
jgi:putative ABC transport system permease protein